MSETLYDFQAERLDGANSDLVEYKGDVVLVVNTASKCGFTPQFEGLEQLYQRYRDRGFSVLGFPCNQFAGQDPGTNKEIGSFCQKNYGVSFPMHAKIDVNGQETHPLYQFLKREAKGMLGTEAIKWNFTKFLVDRHGNVISRHSPKTAPEQLTSEIEELLKQQA